MKNFNQFIHELRESALSALRYATKAHRGQTRSDGSDYVRHPERVARIVHQFKKSHNLDSLISAAYLHDTIEDTNTTHADLQKMFGGLVAAMVQELTSDKDEIDRVGKAEYLTNKMAKMSSWSLVVKLADRLDNVQDIATAKTPEWRAKYKRETLQMLDNLEKKRVLSGTHKKIINAIREKLDEVQ